MVWWRFGCRHSRPGARRARRASGEGAEDNDGAPERALSDLLVGEVARRSVAHVYLQLDDPVHRFIPSWKSLQVFASGNHPNFATAPVARPMTVRDLLSHTSGLTYGFTERTNVDAAYRKLGVADRARPGYTLQAMVNTLAHLPLEAAIRRYIDITNEHPKPLKWTKTADEDPRECRTLLSSYL